MGLLKGLMAREEASSSLERRVALMGEADPVGSHARLASAVACRDIAEVGRLAYAGAVVTSSGRSCALMMAIDSGQVEVVEILAPKADLSVRNVAGRTALMQATLAGHQRMVSALIRSGADVEARDSSGMSAMMMAAACGYVGACSVLASVSDLGRVDNLGLGALEHAAANGKAMCVQLILERASALFDMGRLRRAMGLAGSGLFGGVEGALDALAKEVAVREEVLLRSMLGESGSKELGVKSDEKLDCGPVIDFAVDKEETPDAMSQGKDRGRL